MSALIEHRPGQRQGIAIETTDAAHLAASRRRLTAAQRRWLGESGFEATPGSVALLPDSAGKLARVLVGVNPQDPLAALAGLPCSLPEANYQLASEGVLADPSLAALGWALGAYQFTRYRPAKRAPARLLVGLDLETPPAPTPAVEKTWVRARDGLAKGSFEAADAALAELGKNADPTTRDTARLARALLWTKNGRAQMVAPVLADLAKNAVTPAIRARAAELAH